VKIKLLSNRKIENKKKEMSVVIFVVCLSVTYGVSVNVGHVRVEVPVPSIRF
jgi:hypothetical protein